MIENDSHHFSPHLTHLFHFSLHHGRGGSITTTPALCSNNSQCSEHSDSDAAMAMMINAYAEITGGGLKQFGHCSGGRGMTCPTSGAITCHYQDPEDMKQFALDRNIDIVIQPQPPKR